MDVWAYPHGRLRERVGSYRTRYSRRLGQTDFVAPHAQGPYAIAVDPSSKLYWQTNTIDGDHVVAVLTE